MKRYITMFVLFFCALAFAGTAWAQPPGPQESVTNVMKEMLDESGSGVTREGLTGSGSESNEGEQEAAIPGMYGESVRHKAFLSEAQERLEMLKGYRMLPFNLDVEARLANVCKSYVGGFLVTIYRGDEFYVSLANWIVDEDPSDFDGDVYSMQPALVLPELDSDEESNLYRIEPTMLASSHDDGFIHYEQDSSCSDSNFVWTYSIDGSPSVRLSSDGMIEVPTGDPKPTISIRGEFRSRLSLMERFRGFWERITSPTVR